jgi:hypothetical protein
MQAPHALAGLFEKSARVQAGQVYNDATESRHSSV